MIEGVDYLSEEERQRTNAMFFKPNIWFVYYDERGNILAITNEKKPEGNFVEVSEDLVLDFLTGKKNYLNFTIKGQDVFEERPITKVSHYKDLLVVGDDANAEFRIKVLDNQIHFVLKSEIKDQYQHSGTLQFFIVDKHDHNFLLETMNVKMEELVSLGVILPFAYDMGKVDIITRSFFNSYGIVDV